MAVKHPDPVTLSGTDAARRVRTDARRMMADTDAGHRRGRILQAATRRFAGAGFEATTVRQIADDVNVLSGSLYHHFPTKEAMLHEIVRDAVQHLSALATRIAALPIDPERRLAGLVRAELDELTARQEVHAILYHERGFFRRSADFAYVVEANKRIYLAWRRVLEDGIAHGCFDPALDLYLTVGTIVRMLNTAAHWYMHEDAPVLDTTGAHTIARIADFHLRFILRAVRMPGRAGQPLPDMPDARMAGESGPDST